MSQIELRRNKAPKLNRRSFLAGSGIAMSLPLLEAMLPTGKTAFAQSDTPSRLITMFTGNGMWMDSWTPKSEGRDFELSPSLAPLAPVKDNVLVLSRLHNSVVGNLPGGQARGSAGFLTCSPITPGPLQAGISMDQVIAQQVGSATQFPTLDYAIDGGDGTTLQGVDRNCDNGLSCAYLRQISWSSPTTPVPNESDPRKAFDRLFSQNNNNSYLKRITAYDKSVLDSIRKDANQLEKQLGIKDKEKLQEYLASVQELEARLKTNADIESEMQKACSSFDRPALTDSLYHEKSRAFNQIMVMALQCDLSRVITYMFSNGGSGRTYSHLGISTHHAGISRFAQFGPGAHRDNQQKIDKYHTEELADLCIKLDNTIDVTGKSLLDSTVVYRGSNFTDNATQSQYSLPVVLVGSCNGYFDVGQHIRYAEPGKELGSLYLNIMEAMGTPQTQFATSTEKLPMIKANS